MVATEAKAPGAGFREGFVDADGFHIRYMESGSGPALVHFHGAGGLRLNRAHDMLARKFRVVAFEMPGFGRSAENTRTRDLADLAATMGKATAALGIDRYNLMGTSFGGRVALWLAIQQPEKVPAVVLEAPAAIRPAGTRAPAGPPEEMARRLYAHPEKMPPMPPVDPAVQQQTQALTLRLRGPDRDSDLETQMRELKTPTLVLFGTLDGVIPPEMGHFYKEIMPNAHLVFVYDAGHSIGAERPEAFTEVVEDFLNRHEAFLISKTETLIHP